MANAALCGEVVQDLYNSDEDCDDRGYCGNTIVGVAEWRPNDKVKAALLPGVRELVSKQLHATQEVLAAQHRQTLRIVEDLCTEFTLQKEAELLRLSSENERLHAQLSAGFELGGQTGGTGEAATPTGRVAWGVGSLARQAISTPKRVTSVKPHNGGEDQHVQPSDQSPKLRCAADTMEDEGTTASITTSRALERHAKKNFRRSIAATVLRVADEDLEDREDKKEHQKLTAIFADAASMKEQVKLALMKKEYSVMDLYKKSGLFQRIARSAVFEHITLCVIAVNAVWIAVDTDHNTKATLVGADPVFVAAENVFCAYFVLELIVRFAAFERKCTCLKDWWFVFDGALVVMMTFETWVMSIVLMCTSGMSGDTGMGDASILKLVRLLRLTRMARMARLLKAMPELMILVKGIVVATRSVFFVLCLLVLIIFVFAVCLTQLTTGHEPLHSRYFGTVLESMSTLLLRGVLPDLADLVNTMGEANYAFACIMLFFILLSSLTVMNMLVGVLVEVVSVVSAVEKEQMTMQYVKTMLLSMLKESGIDEASDKKICKTEFEKLLLKPEAARIIQDVGVDVVGLVDFLDFIFKDGQGLSFAEFMDAVLQLRGSNNATVRDVVDLRKYVHNQMSDAVRSVSEAVHSVIECSPKDGQRNGAQDQAAMINSFVPPKKVTSNGVFGDAGGDRSNERNAISPAPAHELGAHTAQAHCGAPAGVAHQNANNGIAPSRWRDQQAQLRSNNRGRATRGRSPSPGIDGVSTYPAPTCPAFPDHWIAEIRHNREAYA